MAELNVDFSRRIVFGSITKLGVDIADWGDRAVMVADAALEDAATSIQDQMDAWGIHTILFARDGLNCDTATLNDALSLSRGSHATMIVGIGGQKALSLARLTAAASWAGIPAGTILDDREVVGSGLPVLEIPASGRHPLLFLDTAILSDTTDRRAAFVRLPRPPRSGVIVDSTLARSRGLGATAESLTVLLAAAVEAFLSPRASFFSEVQAEAAVRRCAALLRNVASEHADPDFRIREAETAVLTAFATGLADPGPGLTLSWSAAIGAGLPKATVGAVLFPWVLDSPLYASSPRIGRLARLLARDDDEAPGSAVDELQSLTGPLGLPGRLRDVGARLDAVLPAARWAAEILGDKRPEQDESTFRDILELAS